MHIFTLDLELISYILHQLPDIGCIVKHSAISSPYHCIIPGINSQFNIHIFTALLEFISFIICRLAEIGTLSNILPTYNHAVYCIITDSGSRYNIHIFY